MKSFMDEDYLIDNELGRLIYENYAAQLPIIDFHCHIDARDIAIDAKYENITQLWLGADHYKWRAMRSCGYPERLITGNASDYEKFEAFCQALPYMMGNPVYEWCHMELKKYFGFEGVLCPDTCKRVWELTSEKLKELSARKIIEMSGVKLICTTNDPIDSLEYHVALKEETSFGTQVVPAFRPDKSLYVERSGYADYIRKLSAVSGSDINSFAALCDVLGKRMEYFDVLGCRSSDQSLECAPVFESSLNEKQAGSIAEVVFRRAMSGEKLDPEMSGIYRTALMRYLAREYSRRGWVMQLHIGALRNVNSVMYSQLGPDSGYDVMGAGNFIGSVADMMNALNSDGILPKTVLYSLNPNDNEPISVLIGAFQYTSDESEGLVCLPKIEQGSAWWFNDNEAGIKAQLLSFSRQCALAKFIGMATDSRSFLSYTRHDYFRRVLCSVVGELAESGKYPLDMDMLAQTVCDICYNNPKDFFGFIII